MPARALIQGLVAFCVTLGILLGAASSALADQNANQCNRQMYCDFWFYPTGGGPPVCKDLFGSATYPTDGGCAGTVCAPCEEAECSIGQQVGSSCECREGWPGLGAACKTCIVVNGSNQVTAFGCINTSCAPGLYDCFMWFPSHGSSGYAKCKCE